MFCRCAHCQTQQMVSVEQLRANRGFIPCANCGKRFDALITLSEDVEMLAIEAADAEDIFRVPYVGHSPRRGIWLSATIISLFVLFTQIWFFEGEGLFRQSWLRNRLLLACQQLGCTIPVYRNPAELSISHSRLEPISAQDFIFTAVLTNQAIYSQAFPDIKLVLLNFSGEAIAERIFAGDQYTANEFLPANETMAINIRIVAPFGIGGVGGYFSVAL